jgi:hypothetical protein
MFVAATTSQPVEIITHPCQQNELARHTAFIETLMRPTGRNSFRILPGLFLMEIRIFSLLAATEFQRRENSGKSTVDL